VSVKPVCLADPFEPDAQIAIQLHEVLFGAGARFFDGVADANRGTQIHFIVSAGRRSSRSR
jgi:hypothetical protein